MVWTRRQPGAAAGGLSLINGFEIRGRGHPFRTSALRAWEEDLRTPPSGPKLTTVEILVVKEELGSGRIMGPRIQNGWALEYKHLNTNPRIRFA